MGQLSLVEHALWPLDSRTSLRENLRHESEYRYTDTDGRTQTASVGEAFVVPFFRPQ